VELEEDRLWRENEVRDLHNQASRRASIEDQERMRRACLVLLYAHFEGFCKFALQSYANQINKLNLKCGEVNIAIARASMEDVFKELTSQKKSLLFRRDLSEDAQLHSRARQQDFLRRIGEFAKLPAYIPDHIINTESNLWSYILRRNLFDLGLPLNFLDPFANDIDGLVHQRNGICHGEVKKGINALRYRRFNQTVVKVSSTLTSNIVQAFQDEHFLNKAA
jgi:hypothetical protein